jgi:hypothetical protein
LTALDPQASETLKIVAYFDALVAGGVGVETIVRGAAVLSGVPAGDLHGGTAVRVGPHGDRLAAAAPDGWPSADASSGDVVWIERTGRPHANDAMVLERFALAVAVSRAQRTIAPEDSVQILLDATRPAPERAAAAARCGLPARVRVVAASASDAVPADGPSTVVATEHGVVRAVVTADTGRLDGIVGAGSWGAPADLAESWALASMALRLARSRGTAVDADGLGVIGIAALALDGAEPPDVRAIARLDPRTRRVLTVLAEADSIRSAATILGMHHSSVQARHEALVAELGYDPRTALGRARFELADILARLR